MLAVSNTFCTRLMAWARCCTSVLRIAHQVAQIANGFGRNEAGFEQAMAQQVGEPFTILNVRFVAGHRLHVLGVDQDDLKAAFQDVEDRSPIDAGAFHGHMGDLADWQPVGQRLQPSRGGGEGAHLFG